MPMGTSARFDAVLRAGEAHRREAAPIGAPGDLPAGALKGKQAADALKKAASADSVIVNDPGAAPVFSKAQSTPAAPQGFQMRKGGGAKPVKADGLGNQVVAKSSEVVKDLIKEYEKDQAERVEALRKARAEGEECAKRRIKAVDAFRDQEEKAARTAIAKLEEMLKKKEAALDKLQNASDESVRKIEQMTREGGESSKQMEDLKKELATCNAQKKSVQEELEAFKVECNKARDVAQREADAELKKLEAAWKLKLDEAEAKAAAGDVKSSKELAECTRKLEKAVEDLEKETKALSAAERDAFEKDKKFYAAAKAACDALSEFTKESPDETFRKKTKDFITSAPAGM